MCVYVCGVVTYKPNFKCFVFVPDVHVVGAISLRQEGQHNDPCMQGKLEQDGGNFDWTEKRPPVSQQHLKTSMVHI